MTCRAGGGIQPGVHRDTRFWETLDQVTQQGGTMYTGTPSTNARGILREINLLLTASAQVRLGDVVLLYGAPEYARTVQSAVLTGGQRRVTTDVYLYWAQGYVEVRAAHPNGAAQLSPRMWVREIVMRSPSPEAIVPLGSSRWHGFGNIERYRYDF